MRSKVDCRLKSLASSVIRPLTGADAIRSCFPAVQVIGTQLYFVYCFLLVG